MKREEITLRFTYHPPQNQGQVDRYQDIRERGLAFAEFVNQSVPDSREKALALTNIEQAVMWANAGIARNE